MISKSCSRCSAHEGRRATARIGRASLLVLSLGAAFAVAACSTTADKGTTPEAGTSTSGANTNGAATTSAGSKATASPTATDLKLAQLRSQLDIDLLAGPSIADHLGYRTLWQTRVETAGGSQLRGSSCTKDEVFVWDSIGVVTRLRPGTGDTLWQAASSSRVDRILSVTALDTSDGKALVALVTDTQAFFFDASNGLFFTRQNFRRMANTPAVLRAPFLIYGTQAGQVVWHNYEVGSESRVAQLDGQVSQAPRLIGDALVAAGTGGTVAAYTGREARQLWARSLKAGISTRVAADDRAVWVSCRDQYLTCLSLKDGRPLWRYFSQAPMDASPVLLEDGLYVQLQGEGVVCFEPLPKDKLDGVVRWRSPQTVGDVIGNCRNGLLAWDAPSSTLTLLEERNGSVIRSFTLKGIADLRMSDPVDGDLLITGIDGRVQRLTPIARRTATKS